MVLVITEAAFCVCVCVGQRVPWNFFCETFPWLVFHLLLFVG